MSLGHPPVTVAVVSYNTRTLLLRCLDSLRAEVESARAAVWVVDNGSQDGSAAAAREHAPWATVMEPGENLGFGSAVNLVAGASDGPWLMAANADVALEPGALPALLERGGDPRVGIVAPRLLADDGSTEHSVHPFPTLPVTLAFNLGLLTRSRHLADRMCLEGHWDPERPRRVPWAIGACLLIRRSAFTAAGGFDPRQWMYAEDVDLAWRMERCGFHTVYEPAARVLHASGAAARQRFGAWRAPQFMAATYAMLRRRRGAATMWLTAAVNIAGAGTRAAWMGAAGVLWPRWRGPAAEQRRWLSAHARGVRGA